MTVDLLAVAKIIVALGGAAAVIWGVIKPVTQVLKKIEKIEKHQRETHMQMLRIAVVSTEMPLEERIKAGDEYVKMGGNGAVKHLYEELLTMLPGAK